ncbi:MAG: hypothetical protein Q9177_004911 [Variospora cf. flavescens]
MPLNYSAAYSSRITKRPLKHPSLRRSASSPFASFNQRKPVQRSKTKPETVQQEDFLGEKLDDIGLVTTLPTDVPLRDVVQMVQYANANMFDPLPEGGGFNSTRISEILNFRKSLPITVTVAHVHALSISPTATEREISELMKANILRKVVVPGRGIGGSTVGEGLILINALEEMLNRSDAVDDHLKQKFLDALKAHFVVSVMPPTALSRTEMTSLRRAGFLTSSTQSSSSESWIGSPSSASTSVSTISKAASGSLAAVGGEGAVVEAGATLGFRRENSHGIDASSLQLSLPNMGPYLRLLTQARAHLTSLLHGSRFREMPLYLLHERWDGGISNDDPAAQAKKYRVNMSRAMSAAKLEKGLSEALEVKNWTAQDSLQKNKHQKLVDTFINWVQQDPFWGLALSMAPEFREGTIQADRMGTFPKKNTANLFHGEEILSQLERMHRPLTEKELREQEDWKKELRSAGVTVVRSAEWYKKMRGEDEQGFGHLSNGVLRVRKEGNNNHG